MTITLDVTPRDQEQAADTLRANGQIPAVVYGPKQETTPVALDAKAFAKVRAEAGESTFISVTGITGGPVDALIHDVDFDPIKQRVLHVDFYVVEQGKEMTTSVHFDFIGEAPVEATNLGTVTKVIQEIEVTCNPSDLPSHIDVDISGLETVEDKILVQDLVLPTGVRVEADGEDPVVVVSAAKSESADEEVDEAVDMDAIAVEHKGKEEDETEA